MSEPKTTCDECNRPILQRTADRKGGLCAICHGAAARIPPDDFVLPAFLRKRILSLGKSTERYREMAWREGNDYVHEFLDRQDKADALYAEWLPKLRKFAKECRRDRAYDPSRRLRISDLAKQRIYRTKFEKENWIPRAGPVPIFTLPLIAISVAEQVWPVGNLGPVPTTGGPLMMLQIQSLITCRWVTGTTSTFPKEVCRGWFPSDRCMGRLLVEDTAKCGRGTDGKLHSSKNACNG